MTQQSSVEDRKKNISDSEPFGPVSRMLENRYTAALSLKELKFPLVSPVHFPSVVRDYQNQKLEIAKLPKNMIILLAGSVASHDEYISKWKIYYSAKIVKKIDEISLAYNTHYATLRKKPKQEYSKNLAYYERLTMVYKLLLEWCAKFHINDEIKNKLDKSLSAVNKKILILQKNPYSKSELDLTKNYLESLVKSTTEELDIEAVYNAIYQITQNTQSCKNPPVQSWKSPREEKINVENPQDIPKIFSAISTNILKLDLAAKEFAGKKFDILNIPATENYVAVIKNLDNQCAQVTVMLKNFRGKDAIEYKKTLNEYEEKYHREIHQHLESIEKCYVILKETFHSLLAHFNKKNLFSSGDQFVAKMQLMCATHQIHVWLIRFVIAIPLLNIYCSKEEPINTLSADRAALIEKDQIMAEKIGSIINEKLKKISPTCPDVGVLLVRTCEFIPKFDSAVETVADSKIQHLLLAAASRQPQPKITVPTPAPVIEKATKLPKKSRKNIKDKELDLQSQSQSVDEKPEMAPEANMSQQEVDKDKKNKASQGKKKNLNKKNLTTTKKSERERKSKEKKPKVSPSSAIDCSELVSITGAPHEIFVNIKVDFMNLQKQEALMSNEVVAQQLSAEDRKKTTSGSSETELIFEKIAKVRKELDLAISELDFPLVSPTISFSRVIKVSAEQFDLIKSKFGPQSIESIKLAENREYFLDGERIFTKKLREKFNRIYISFRDRYMMLQKKSKQDYGKQLVCCERLVMVTKMLLEWLSKFYVNDQQFKNNLDEIIRLVSSFVLMLQNSPHSKSELELTRAYLETLAKSQKKPSGIAVFYAAIDQITQNPQPCISSPFLTLTEKSQQEKKLSRENPQDAMKIFDAMEENMRKIDLAIKEFDEKEFDNLNLPATDVYVNVIRNIDHQRVQLATMLTEFPAEKILELQERLNKFNGEYHRKHSRHLEAIEKFYLNLQGAFHSLLDHYQAYFSSRKLFAKVAKVQLLSATVKIYAWLAEFINKIPLIEVDLFSARFKQMSCASDDLEELMAQDQRMVESIQEITAQKMKKFLPECPNVDLLLLETCQFIPGPHYVGNDTMEDSKIEHLLIAARKRSQSFVSPSISPAENDKKCLSEKIEIKNKAPLDKPKTTVLAVIEQAAKLPGNSYSKNNINSADDEKSLPKNKNISSTEKLATKNKMPAENPKIPMPVPVPVPAPAIEKITKLPEHSYSKKHNNTFASIDTSLDRAEKTQKTLQEKLDKLKELKDYKKTGHLINEANNQIKSIEKNIKSVKNQRSILEGLDNYDQARKDKFVVKVKDIESVLESSKKIIKDKESELQSESQSIYEKSEAALTTNISEQEVDKEKKDKDSKNITKKTKPVKKNHKAKGKHAKKKTASFEKPAKTPKNTNVTKPDVRQENDQPVSSEERTSDSQDQQNLQSREQFKEYQSMPSPKDDEGPQSLVSAIDQRQNNEQKICSELAETQPLAENKSEDLKMRLGIMQNNPEAGKTTKDEENKDHKNKSKKPNLVKNNKNKTVWLKKPPKIVQDTNVAAVTTNNVTTRPASRGSDEPQDLEGRSEQLANNKIKNLQKLDDTDTTDFQKLIREIFSQKITSEVAVDVQQKDDEDSRSLVSTIDHQRRDDKQKKVPTKNSSQSHASFWGSQYYVKKKPDQHKNDESVLPEERKKIKYATEPESEVRFKDPFVNPLVPPPPRASVPTPSEEEFYYQDGAAGLSGDENQETIFYSDDQSDNYLYSWPDPAHSLDKPAEQEVSHLPDGEFDQQYLVAGLSTLPPLVPYEEVHETQPLPSLVSYEEVNEPQPSVDNKAEDLKMMLMQLGIMKNKPETEKKTTLPTSLHQPKFTHLPESFTLADIEAKLTPEKKQALLKAVKLREALKKIGVESHIHGTFIAECGFHFSGIQFEAHDVDLDVRLPEGMTLAQLLAKVHLEKPPYNLRATDGGDHFQNYANGKLEVSVKTSEYKPKFNPFPMTGHKLFLDADPKDTIVFSFDKSSTAELKQDLLNLRFRNYLLFSNALENVTNFFPRFAKYHIRCQPPVKMLYYCKKEGEENTFEELPVNKLGHYLERHFKKIFAQGEASYDFKHLIYGVIKMIGEGTFTSASTKIILEPLCVAQLSFTAGAEQLEPRVLFRAGVKMAAILQLYFDTHITDTPDYYLLAKQFMDQATIMSLAAIPDNDTQIQHDWVKYLESAKEDIEYSNAWSSFWSVPQDSQISSEPTFEEPQWQGPS